jgi:hypothetical protein
MKNPSVPTETKIVALRVVDLRAEFEAQLRAVCRLEEQLRKTKNGHDQNGRDLARIVRHELTEMLDNNGNVRNVLNELALEQAGRDRGVGIFKADAGADRSLSAPDSVLQRHRT